MPAIAKPLFSISLENLCSNRVTHSAFSVISVITKPSMGNVYGNTPNTVKLFLKIPLADTTGQMVKHWGVMLWMTLAK